MYFSRGTPNLATVIPAIDLIDETFTNAIRDANVNLAIRSAIILAKKTLNKYYSLSDQSAVYRIAMSKSLRCPTALLGTYLTLLVLHPRHKLEYFRNAGWEDAWVVEAERLFREEYTKNYAPLESNQSEGEGDRSSDEEDDNRTPKVCC